MHKILLTLLLALPFAACSKHTGGIVVSDAPLPPINQPDQRSIDPGSSGSQTGSQTGGTPSSSTSLSETSNTTPPSGGNTTTSNSTSGGSGGNGGSIGQGGTGGTQNGGPVPEPSTLFLVGTGLAGLAGASLRRRRRKQA